MSKRYYMSKDDDGHLYVVPVKLQDEWESFLERVYTQEDYDEKILEGVISVGGAMSLVTFENPIFK